MECNDEFLKEVKKEEESVLESKESGLINMVSIKEEAVEGKSEPDFLLEMSQGSKRESCQVFVKEEVEEENLEKPSPVLCSEEDPLRRLVLFGFHDFRLDHQLSVLLGLSSHTCFCCRPLSGAIDIMQ